ncbi:MAG: RIP metalloprotease RseP [Oceanospirillaceae bacterium]|nr:RIP metalloprotease RseP [Oceanospirillaceae bacterium]
MLTTILTTLFALAVLVSIHEAGHFFVARWSGVKVLRFSVGFGRPIFQRIGQDGTEYVLAWLPLGGYVRMLDTRNDDVPKHEMAAAFDQQKVWVRIAIVAAGPIVNLVFAALLYAVVQMAGTTQLIPVIGPVLVDSPAQTAGLTPVQQIISIDGQATRSWEAVNLALAKRIGATGHIEVALQPLDSAVLQQQAVQANTSDKLPLLGPVVSYSVPVNRWLADAVQTSPISQLGIQPWRPNVPIVIDRVIEGGAAQRAGLLVGDKIIAFNQRSMAGFNEFVAYVQSHPDASVLVALERRGELLILPLTLHSDVDQTGGLIGKIGVGVASISWPYSIQYQQQLGLLEGLIDGSQKTLEMVSLTLSFLGRMVQGVVSTEHLSGPISIAKVAAASAATGLITYISFMAYLSVSLGVLNLLPVPMLDGGHLLYYFIELVTGRKVPDRIQAVGLRIGMALVFSVTIIAIANDLMRH